MSQGKGARDRAEDELIARLYGLSEDTKRRVSNVVERLRAGLKASPE